jgi:pimeloyl-ACP methyl ester carboxylesterase
MEDAMTRRQFLQSSLSLALASRVEAGPDPRRFADTGFGRIAYVDQGQGEAALFLHGFPLNSWQWRGAIERLSGLRRCIAADMMAHGLTEMRDGQDVSVTAQASMLVDLLDRLDVGRFDIVANDSGGAVAQILMARYPQRVRSALLTNCDTEPDSPPPTVAPVIDLARKGLYAEKLIVPWVADKDLARSPKGLGGLTYTRPQELSDQILDLYLGPLVSSARRKEQIDAYAVALAPNPLLGLEAELKRSPIPVRVVWGMADRIFNPAEADYLAGLFPKSQGLRKLPEAKLFWPEEYPDVIAEEAKRLWGA